MRRVLTFGLPVAVVCSSHAHRPPEIRLRIGEYRWCSATVHATAEGLRIDDTSVFLPLMHPHFALRVELVSFAHVAQGDPVARGQLVLDTIAASDVLPADGLVALATVEEDEAARTPFAQIHMQCLLEPQMDCFIQPLVNNLAIAERLVRLFFATMRGRICVG